MIRFAKKEDGEALARLILVILKDMELPFVTEYGEETALNILAEAVALPDYRYSYQRGLVMEIDGKVAGGAFGYPATEEEGIDEPLIPLLKKYGIPEDTRLFVDMEAFPGEWYLDSICVSEEFRGQGIGSQLLDALPKLVLRDQETVIGLSVDKANPDAKRLYERKGFQVVGQRTISGHLYDHMQKKIDEN